MLKLGFVSLLFGFGTIIAMDTPENNQAKQLWDAITRGDSGEFDRLLSAGVSPLIPYTYSYQGNIRSRLPIICAVSCYRYDMVAKLLEICPAQQIKGNKEGTLMEFAATQGSWECIPLLRSHGAIVDEEAYRLACFTTCCTEERKQATMKEFKKIILSKTAKKAASPKAHID